MQRYCFMKSLPKPNSFQSFEKLHALLLFHGGQGGLSPTCNFASSSGPDSNTTSYVMPSRRLRAEGSLLTLMAFAFFCILVAFILPGCFHDDYELDFTPHVDGKHLKNTPMLVFLIKSLLNDVCYCLLYEVSHVGLPTSMCSKTLYALGVGRRVKKAKLWFKKKYLHKMIKVSLELIIIPCFVSTLKIITKVTKNLWHIIFSSSLHRQGMVEVGCVLEVTVPLSVCSGAPHICSPVLAMWLQLWASALPCLLLVLWLPLDSHLGKVH